MKNEEVVVLMNKYMDIKQQAAHLEAEKKKLIDQTLPKEIREKVTEIEEEFADKSEKVQKDLERLEEEIKIGVVSLQQSLTVKGMKAFYNQGRVSWDAKGLDGVAKSNPEIANVIGKYRKVGKDYASFRFDGGKEADEE